MILIVSTSAFLKAQSQLERLSYTSSSTFEFDKVNDRIIMTGDLTLSTGLLQFLNAEKIIYDKAKNEIVATSFKSFTFNGSIQIASNAECPKVLRYKLGEQIAYLE